MTDPKDASAYGKGEYLSSQHTAEFLDVPRSTIARLVKNGSLKAIRLGPRRHIFRRADVEEFLASRTDAARSNGDPRSLKIEQGIPAPPKHSR